MAVLQFSSRVRCSACSKIAKPKELVRTTDGCGPLICPPCYWELQERILKTGKPK